MSMKVLTITSTNFTKIFGRATKEECESRRLTCTCGNVIANLVPQSATYIPTNPHNPLPTRLPPLSRPSRLSQPRPHARTHVSLSPWRVPKPLALPLSLSSHVLLSHSYATQANTQLPSFAAPGARQRPCFASSARSARDPKGRVDFIGDAQQGKGQLFNGSPL
jgi:hypothetical protein